MNCHLVSKDWLDCVIAVAPIVISIVVGWFAWVQAATNKTKLRLDLYNRRFAVYEKTLNYYLASMDSDIEDSNLKDKAVEFVRVFRESIFLFGKDSDVHKTLIQIKDTLGFLIQYYKLLHSKLPDGDRLKAYSNKKEILPDMEMLLLKLEDVLSPWLDFHRVEKP